MTGLPNLNCKQMEEALDAYYDLELSAAEAEAVDLHLADCSACAAKLKDIDMVVSKLKILSSAELEWKGDLSDAIEARILAQSASPAEALVAANVKIANVKTDNVVPISSASKFAGYLKPRYILASAASILALFFAYNQFGLGQHRAAEVAEIPTVKTMPLVKQNKNGTNETQLAALPPVVEKNDTTKYAPSTESVPELVKVATLPDLKIPVKPSKIETTKVETTTEKMLANSEQGVAGRDSNNNHVNDSEEIVASYDYDTIDSASDFGISTNEDGLYAIKL
ncbi:hypothetical protein BH11CYA1_BH11CYA1_41870 [soil metagenome]